MTFLPRSLRNEYGEPPPGGRSGNEKEGHTLGEQGGPGWRGLLFAEGAHRHHRFQREHLQPHVDEARARRVHWPPDEECEGDGWLWADFEGEDLGWVCMSSRFGDPLEGER